MWLSGFVLEGIKWVRSREYVPKISRCVLDMRVQNTREVTVVILKGTVGVVQQE